MSVQYDFKTLKEAILFNTIEVLPTDEAQLDQEIQTLVDEANKSGEKIRHYIGFEISGQIHIGTGMMTAIKIKKLQDAGVKCTVWLANYHTWLNNKLDGQMKTIIEVKNNYFSPVFKECCVVVGCDVENIDFLGAEEEYFKPKNGRWFWDYMMKTARNLSLSRVNKSVTITGKQAGESVEFGILCYPVMQVADAFFLQSHLVHAGMDQRKCHVLMREVAPHMNEGFDLKIGQKSIKPIAVHHNLLLSLGVNPDQVSKRMNADNNEELKMSKSKPDSAVWVHDSLEEISRKLKKAYCPMPQLEQNIEIIKEEQKFNPVLNWCEYLVYPADKTISVERPEKFGGNKNYRTYQELETDYLAGNLHPLDLKNAVATTLADWFSPIRTWVEQNPAGLELVKSVKK